jgi:hypothetical protein
MLSDTCHYNRYVEFKSIIICQVVHLVDRPDLFKFSNLVYNRTETVRILYCSLQGQIDRRFMVVILTYNDLYTLPIIVRVVKSRLMRWAGHVARMGEDKGMHKVLVRKTEGKRPTGRPRRRWEDNIKVDFQEVGGGRVFGWSWLRIGTGGGHLWVR